MPQPATSELLIAHPFLEGLDERHIAVLAPMASEVAFATDEIIFRIGDQADYFYLLLSGLVALEVPTPVRTFRIQTVGDGDELGWSTLLAPGSKQFQARCVDAARALAFEGTALRAACGEDPEFGYAILQRTLRTVAERLQMTRIQLIDMYKPVGNKPL